MPEHTPVGRKLASPTGAAYDTAHRGVVFSAYGDNYTVSDEDAARLGVSHRRVLDLAFLDIARAEQSFWECWSDSVMPRFDRVV